MKGAALAADGRRFVRLAQALASEGAAGLAVLDASAIEGAEQLDDVALEIFLVAIKLVFDLLVDLAALVVDHFLFDLLLGGLSLGLGLSNSLGDIGCIGVDWTRRRVQAAWLLFDFELGLVGVGVGIGY